MAPRVRAVRDIADADPLHPRAPRDGRARVRLGRAPRGGRWGGELRAGGERVGRLRARRSPPRRARGGGERSAPYEPIRRVARARLASRSGERAMASFDRTFASYASSEADLATAITPSVRKLTLSWRIPLHFEIRPGAFIVVPVALPVDETSLAWLLGAVRFFGEKAAKRVK